MFLYRFSSAALAMSSFISLVDLLEETNKLTDWYTLGVFLKMPSEDLDDLEKRFSTAGLKRCKIALFSLWLERNPNASWDQIAQALEKCDQIAMAERIRKCHPPPSLPACPATASVPPPSQEAEQQPVKLVRLEKDKVIKFRKLEASYAKLIFNLKTSLDERQLSPVKLARYLIGLLMEDNELLQASTIDELFHLIEPHYCFLNTAILGDIIERFIGQPLKNELDEYERQLEQFKDSTSMALLEEIGPQCSPSTGAPQVTIKLTNCWLDVTINRFQKFVKQIFEENFTALANINMKKGCISVTWLARRSAILSLIAHAQDKTQFMRLVGVLRVSVGGIDILEQEEEEDTFLSSALDRATRADSVDAVVTLLDLEADPNSSDTNGVTSLMIACARGNIRIATLLLQARANINQQNIKGETALMYACCSETPNIDLVRLLIQYGADANLKSSSKNQTALMLAAEYGHTSIVQLLLEKGATVNAQDVNGITALMEASESGHSETARVLLDNGADVNILAWSKKVYQTALILACGFQRTECVDLLLDNGANPNPSESEVSPLIAACVIHNQPMDPTILEKLLSAGADPNTQDADYGDTALMVAADYGYDEGIQILLRASADINIQNSFGSTALHYAAEQGMLSTCKLILASGAQASLTDSDGNTPLSLAQHYVPHHEVCVFLRSVMDSDPTATQDKITKPVQDSSQPRDKSSRRILPKRRRGFFPTITRLLDILLPNRAIKHRHSNQAQLENTSD